MTVYQTMTVDKHFEAMITDKWQIARWEHWLIGIIQRPVQWSWISVTNLVNAINFYTGFVDVEITLNMHMHTIFYKIQSTLVQQSTSACKKIINELFWYNLQLDKYG